MKLIAREILWCYNAAFGVEELREDFIERYIKLNNRTHNAQTLALLMHCNKRFWVNLKFV